MFPVNIEEREREARDEMVRRGRLPLPIEPAVAEQLRAAGVVCLEWGAYVDATLPPGWRAEADPLEHRRWHLLDERGRRRFVAFWKDAGYEPAHGGVSAVEDDGIVQRWEGRDSEHCHRTGRLRVTFVCPCGKHYAGVELGAMETEERPAWARSVIERRLWHLRASLDCQVQA